MNEKGEDFGIRLYIKNYEGSKVLNEIIVVFNIIIVHEFNEWSVTRSLQHFRELNRNLTKGFFNAPSYPYLHSIRNEADLNIQMQSLDEYLNILIRRADLINSAYLKEFLELDRMIPDSSLFKPTLLNVVNDSSMEITDIFYSGGLLFAGLSYSSSTGGIKSYLNSLGALWHGSTLGGLRIYSLTKGDYGESLLQKILSYDLHSGVSKLKFFNFGGLNLLIISFDDGALNLFKINIREKVTIESFSKINPHYNRIIDFGVELKAGYIYSASTNEKTISITEMNYESVLLNYTPTGHNLTNFNYDGENRRIFVTDEIQNLTVIIVEDFVSFRVVATYNENEHFNLIRIEPDRNYLFALSEGFIRLYAYEEGHEKLIKIECKLDIPLFNSVAKDIKLIKRESVIAVAMSNGSVAFWSHHQSHPEYVEVAHSKSVNKILHVEDEGILITSSSDKTIKVWKIPDHFVSEMTRKNKDINDRFLIEDNSVNKINILKIQNAFSNELFSDEDSEAESRPLKDAEHTPFEVESHYEAEVHSLVKTLNSNKVESPDSKVTSSEYNTTLDGWENEIPMKIKEKNIYNIYNFK